MRVGVGSQEAQAGRKALLDGHLQRMVCRKTIGGGKTVAGYSRCDAIQKFTRSDGARSWNRLVDVVCDIQIAAQIAQIGSFEDNIVGQLTLHAKIELLGVSVLEVWRDTVP